MEWEFTAEQVVKGQVDYGLQEFRRDLLQEIRMNVGTTDAAVVRATRDLIYDLCYWRATGKPFEGFVATFAHDPPTAQFLRSVDECMQANIEMLGAILQRLIMDRVEAAMPLEQALRDVAEYHAQAVREASMEG